MTGVNEARLDSRRYFGPLVVLDRTNERLEIAHIRLFEEWFEWWLLRARASLVFAFEIRFLQGERIFQDQRGDLEGRLGRINRPFISFASQNRKPAHVIEMPMRQHHGIKLATLQFGCAPILGFLFAAALKHAAVDQNARILRNDMVSRPSDIAGSTMKMNLHQFSLR